MKNFLWGYSIYLYLTAAASFSDLEINLCLELREADVGIFTKLLDETTDTLD